MLEIKYNMSIKTRMFHLQLICLIMLTLVDSLPTKDEDKRKASEFVSRQIIFNYDEWEIDN